MRVEIRIKVTAAVSIQSAQFREHNFPLRRPLAKRLRGNAQLVRRIHQRQHRIGVRRTRFDFQSWCFHCSFRSVKS